MSFLGLLVNTVSIYRPTVTYVKGVATKTYPGTATHESVACSIQFHRAGALGIGGGSQQPTSHGYETIEGWWIGFDYGTDVLKDDKLMDERGRVFIVQTVPVDVTGRQHHIECFLSLQEES